MEFNKINESLTVSGQIDAQDMATLAERGFRAVIDNRPDMEVGPEQSSEAMAKAAQAAGLLFLYLPIIPGQFTPDLIAAMSEALAELEGPVYAYCRSGTRSTTLWALTQAGKIGAEEILQQAADAGYDLRGIAAYLNG